MDMRSMKAVKDERKGKMTERKMGRGAKAPLFFSER